MPSYRDSPAGYDPFKNGSLVLPWFATAEEATTIWSLLREHDSIFWRRRCWEGGEYTDLPYTTFTNVRRGPTPLKIHGFSG